MPSDDELARELLLRDAVEVTLLVDVDTARITDDATLAAVLGPACVEQLRTILEEEDG